MLLLSSCSACVFNSGILPKHSGLHTAVSIVPVQGAHSTDPQVHGTHDNCSRERAPQRRFLRSSGEQHEAGTAASVLEVKHPEVSPVDMGLERGPVVKVRGFDSEASALPSSWGMDVNGLRFLFGAMPWN